PVAIRVDIERSRSTLDDLFGDHDFLDAFEAREVKHGVEQNSFHNRAQPASAGLAINRLAGDGAEGLLGEGEINRLHLEQSLVLLDQRVLGLRENELQRRLIKVLKRG